MMVANEITMCDGSFKSWSESNQKDLRRMQVEELDWTLGKEDGEGEGI